MKLKQWVLILGIGVMLFVGIRCLLSKLKNNSNNVFKTENLNVVSENKENQKKCKG